MASKTKSVGPMRLLLSYFTLSAVSTDAGAGSGISFVRIHEPNESAFSILAPQGRRNQGGIFRVNAAQAGGPLNAMAAKCDWLLMRDAKGTVAFRMLPDSVYAHTGIGGGFFQPGGCYQGAEVRALADAPHPFDLSHSCASSECRQPAMDHERIPGATGTSQNSFEWILTKLVGSIGKLSLARPSTGKRS
jgi:hypothetical protein